MDKPIEPNLGNKLPQRSIDNVIDGVHHGLDAVSDATSPALHKISVSAHHALDSLASGANHAVDAIANGTAKLQHAQQHFGERCRCQVRDKPLVSVGTAMVAGMLFSWWLNRSRKTEH